MEIVEKIKNAGLFIFGIGGFLLLTFISVLIIRGSIMVGETVIPWLIDASWIAFFLNLFTTRIKITKQKQNSF